MCHSSLLWNIKVILRLIIQDFSMFLNDMIFGFLIINTMAHFNDLRISKLDTNNIIHITYLPPCQFIYLSII